MPPSSIRRNLLLLVRVPSKPHLPPPLWTGPQLPGSDRVDKNTPCNWRQECLVSHTPTPGPEHLMLLEPHSSCTHSCPPQPQGKPGRYVHRNEAAGSDYDNTLCICHYSQPKRSFLRPNQGLLIKKTVICSLQFTTCSLFSKLTLPDDRENPGDSLLRLLGYRSSLCCSESFRKIFVSKAIAENKNSQTYGFSLSKR